jgi:hypothetical protein
VLRAFGKGHACNHHSDGFFRLNERERCSRFGDHALPISTGLAAGSTVKYATACAKTSCTTRTNPEPTAQAFDRDHYLARVKSGAIELGIIWVRENVFNKYSVKTVGALTDAQLVEVDAVMAAERVKRNGTM